MTNMFKKSLLALAVVGFASNASAAVLDVGATGVQATTQFLATNDELDLPTDFTVEAGANYAENDLIKLTFTGAEFVMADFEQVVALGAAANLNLLSVTKSGASYVALYRVTDVTATTSGVESDPLFAAGATLVSSKVTGAVTVSFSAETSGGFEVDTGGDDDERTITLVKTFDQFATVTVTASLDDTIDVSDKRETFVGADADDTADNVTEAAVGSFTIAQQAATPAFVATDAATVDSIDYTLTGDFSWALDADGEYIADSVTPACAGFADLEVVADKATWTCTTAAVTVTLETADMETETIPTSTFGLTAKVNFSGADGEGSKTISAAAGEWGLNGASVHIPYMAYNGDAITQVINLNNAGSQTGDITVEGFDAAGNDFGPVVVGSAAPGKQIALAGAIKKAIEDAGLPVNSRISLTLVADVPQADVTVYSAYNTGGNGARIVVNSSNGK